MPEWKKMLIQKAYTNYPNSLAMELDAKRTLSIATDGIKIDTKSGKLTAYGGNPIFGNKESIHSHRFERYAT